MSSHFPPRGNFADFPIHEMMVKLIRGRFSGSAEIRSAAAARIFHFDGGNLCAATSDHPEETLDTILERTISPTLTREQKHLVKGRIMGGQAYAKALVELGILHATELLAYHRNLAEVILRGALNDVPETYRLSPGQQHQYNPVPFDPLRAIRDSILNDLDSGFIADRLGDEAVFVPSEVAERERRSRLYDPESELILSHLDGIRRVGELAGRLGMNPTRTRGLLYFMKLSGMITPAASGAAGAAAEAPVAGGEGAVRAYGDPGASNVEDSTEILRLLENEESADESSTVDDNGATFNDSLQEKLGVRVAAGQATDEKEQASGRRRRLPPVMWKLLLIYGLPAIAGMFIVYDVLLFLNAPPGDKEPRRLSIYQEDTDKSQLPLGEDFTARRPRETLALEVPLKKPDDSGNGAAGEAEPTDVRTVSGPDPSAEGQGDAGPPTGADAPEDRGSDEPISTEREQSGERLTDGKTFAAVQQRALQIGHQGNWQEAAALWREPVLTEAAGNFTLLIIRVGRPGFVSGVFEKFANNENLRNRFFVFRAEEEYIVCWGLFSDSAAAAAEAGTLPARIRAYRPSPLAVNSLLRSR